MAIPKFHGAFAVTALNDQMTVNAIGVVIPLSATVGDWFIRGYTGEAIGSGRTGAQYLEEIQAQVIAGGLTNFTATVSDTGFVTLANSATFTVTWPDTATRDLLGFTAGLSSSTSYTAPNQHKYAWYPPVQLKARTGDERVAGNVTADTTVSRSASGRVTTTSFGEFVDRVFEFHSIPKHYVYPVLGLGEGTLIVNRSWEDFWRAVMKIGKRLRWYPDRTVQTATGGGAPFEYVAGKDTAKGGTNVWTLTSQHSDLYLNGELEAHKYV